MIKIGKAGDVRRAQAAKRTANASAPFSAAGADAPRATDAARAAAAPAAATMLGGLIALQSEDRPRAKTIAAVQRTLKALDRLHLKLVEGVLSGEDLHALADAASERAHAGADPHLQQIYHDVALRARVELAKRGR